MPQAFLLSAITGYWVRHPEKKWLAWVLGIIFVLAIAFFGGLWLADQAMRPVHTITQTARQISETDLHKRLHLDGDDAAICIFQ